MNHVSKVTNNNLLKGAGISILVLMTAACQNDGSLAAGGSGSEELLSIPSAINMTRALTTARMTSSLKVNGQAVSSTVRSNSLGYVINADLQKTILFVGSENSLDLSLKYPCGINDDELELVGVAKSFSYSGSEISITTTSDREPDSDRDGISNLIECEEGFLAYDQNSPIPLIVNDQPTTGSVLFSVGIADNRFYDTDTNDSQFLRLDGAIQELNDNFSQAKEIGSHAETTGYVSSVSDEDDYYRVTGSGVGSVSLVSANEGANLDLYIYNNDGSFAFSSTRGAGIVELLSDLYLPFYIRVNAVSGGGSLYKLETSVGTQFNTPSTAVARFKLNLIDSTSNDVLAGDGIYDSTFIVNGNLNETQVLLTDVPTGNYNYEVYSDVNEDDGNIDTFYSMGVTATGSITISSGEQLSRGITLE